MTNKITSSISKVVTDKRSHEFKARIDNLPGNNWKKEIKELATEFSLDAEHIIADIKHFLTDTLTPEHIEKELKENAKEYKKFYEIMKNESFKEAEEIVESLSAYIEKLKTNTQQRLTHVLLANPRAAHRMPIFMKNVLGEEETVKETVKEIDKGKKDNNEALNASQEQKEERLIKEFTNILHNN
jgi:thymidylate synthase